MLDSGHYGPWDLKTESGLWCKIKYFLILKVKLVLKKYQ
jgi:hypothetical protein